jgi:hypothetical protein
MSPTTPELSDEQNDNPHSPPMGKPVLVQCSGYSCLAYRDCNGRWRDHFNGTELEGPVIVIPF